MIIYFRLVLRMKNIRCPICNKNQIMNKRVKKFIILSLSNLKR